MDLVLWMLICLLFPPATLLWVSGLLMIRQSRREFREADESFEKGAIKASIMFEKAEWTRRNAIARAIAGILLLVIFCGLLSFMLFK